MYRLEIDPNYRSAPIADSGNQQALMHAATIFAIFSKVEIACVDVEPPVFEGESVFDEKTLELGFRQLKADDIQIGPNQLVVFDQMLFRATDEGITRVVPERNAFQFSVLDYESNEANGSINQYIVLFESYNPLEGAIYRGVEIDDDSEVVDDELYDLTDFLQDLERLVVVRWMNDTLTKFPEIDTTHFSRVDSSE